MYQPHRYEAERDYRRERMERIAERRRARHTWTLGRTVTGIAALIHPASGARAHATSAAQPTVTRAVCGATAVRAAH